MKMGGGHKSQDLHQWGCAHYCVSRSWSHGPPRLPDPCAYGQVGAPHPHCTTCKPASSIPLHCTYRRTFPNMMQHPALHSAEMQAPPMVPHCMGTPSLPWYHKLCVLYRVSPLAEVGEMQQKLEEEKASSRFLGAAVGHWCPGGNPEVAC